MRRTLEVRFGELLVGRVRIDDADQFAFAYVTTWLDEEPPFPVSLTLPLTDHEYIGGAAHSFFSNLLPEGAVRQSVCERLGISADNDFALLSAIGGECAGALSLVEPGSRKVALSPPVSGSTTSTRITGDQGTTGGEVAPRWRSPE
jgi:serine/threonine-protein kinase HipA